MFKSFSHLSISFFAMLLCLPAFAMEFSLKYVDGSMIYGPFEMKEGGKVELDGTLFTVADIDKYGHGTFILQSGAASYGPFNMNNKSRVIIEKSAYTLLVVDEGERRGRSEPTKAQKGKLESTKLIQFEASLDAVESQFGSAVRTQERLLKTTGYDASMNSLVIDARALQAEVVKAGMNLDINIGKEVMLMKTAYEDAKSQYLGYGQYVPDLLSTRRNRRLPGGQPGTSMSNSKEDSYIKGNFIECCILFDWHSFYSQKYRTFINARSHRIKNSENMRNSLIDFVEAVARIRRIILQLESTGNWDTIARNGQTFYIRNAQDAYY